MQVVNLGNDANTAGAVVGALAGAAYGLSAIPVAWRAALHGEWPLRSGVRWDTSRLAALADWLAKTEATRAERGGGPCLPPAKPGAAQRERRLVSRLIGVNARIPGVHGADSQVNEVAHATRAR